MGLTFVYGCDVLSHSAFEGLIHPNKALTLRHGGKEQEACVPWVAKNR